MKEAIGEAVLARAVEVARDRWGERLLASGLPLGERLSVFWGSPASLRGAAEVGRFPPHDRLDLIRHGRLLAGRDVRDGLPVPDTREMVLAAARQALRSLA